MMPISNLREYIGLLTQYIEAESGVGNVAFFGPFPDGMQLDFATYQIRATSGVGDIQLRSNLFKTPVDNADYVANAGRAFVGGVPTPGTKELDIKIPVAGSDFFEYSGTISLYHVFDTMFPFLGVRLFSSSVDATIRLSLHKR